jgi:hypothetical protein
VQDNDSEAAAAATVAADPLASYDQALLLQYGVAAWSYPVPVTPGQLDRLDERTAEWAARRIAVLNSPPTGTDAGNDRKNA